MKQTHRKCKCCGAIISSDPTSISYSPKPEAKHCLRCWNLLNYQKETSQELASKKANENCNALKISDNDLIFLVVVFLNINFNLIKKYQTHKNLIIVFNKADLILNNFKYHIIKKNIDNFLNQLQIKPKKIVFSSTKNNYGIRTINDVIIHQKLKTKIYFIGDTNTGKSSIINSLLKLNKNFHKQLPVSSYLNTTINFYKAKIANHSVIDCPGSEDSTNILKYIVNQDTKLLNLKKIKSSFFLVKKEQYFYLDNLAWIKLTPLINCSISFYLNIDIEIKRKSNNTDFQNCGKLTLKDETSFKKIEFNLNSNETKGIQISGVGHIYCKNIKKIEIYVPKNIKIDYWDGRIC